MSGRRADTGRMQPPIQHQQQQQQQQPQVQAIFTPSQPVVPPRQAVFTLDATGIERQVISTDICRYLGNDALVRPGKAKDPATGKEVDVYLVTAYRDLTSAMIQDLKMDSTRWRAEAAQRQLAVNQINEPDYRNSSTLDQSITRMNDGVQGTRPSSFAPVHNSGQVPQQQSGGQYPPPQYTTPGGYQSSAAFAPPVQYSPPHQGYAQDPRMDPRAHDSRSYVHGAEYSTGAGRPGANTQASVQRPNPAPYTNSPSYSQAPYPPYSSQGPSSSASSLAYQPAPYASDEHYGRGAYKQELSISDASYHYSNISNKLASPSGPYGNGPASQPYAESRNSFQAEPQYQMEVQYESQGYAQPGPARTTAPNTSARRNDRDWDDRERRHRHH